MGAHSGSTGVQFETMDLKAPGAVRDYAERYQGIDENLCPQMQRRVYCSGEVMGRVQAESRAMLPAEQLQKRQVWRDRRLLALLTHKARARASMTST